MSNNMKAAIEKNSTKQVPFMFEDMIFRNIENHIFEKEIKAIKTRERFFTILLYGIAACFLVFCFYNFNHKYPISKTLILQFICGFILFISFWSTIRKEVSHLIEQI